MEKPSNLRLETVDALRGIAALAVCFFHFTNGTDQFLPEGLLKTVGSYGNLGVEIFFVISGFIIPYALHRVGYEVSQYGTFVLKRIIRLDPPYIATILIILPLGYLAAATPGFAGSPYHPSMSQVLLHLAYLNVFFGSDWLNPVFWTLAIEFQYYLAVGLIFPSISHCNKSVRWGLFIALGILTLAFPQPVFIFHWLYLFMFGMFTFQYYAGFVKMYEFAIGLIAITAGAFFTLGPIIAGVGLATACTIAFTNYSNRVLTFFGGISYSLYLIHLTVGGKVVNFGSRFGGGLLTKLAIIVLALILSVVAAYLLHRFVEKPAQRWSSLIKYSRLKSMVAGPTHESLSLK